MCDTLIALPARPGAPAVFGKNSDRERNEAQGLELHPAVDHPAGATLKATYIEIPQARRTHQVLISRPFWMWGAEMGANAHGVVIGNEAVHSTVPAARRRALTGMDLVRLGLERGASAGEALEVIIQLLERHGQGGDCGHYARFYYHNSFIVADAREAYVLETVGRWWAVEHVEGRRALSNALSIGRHPDALSPALKAHAQAQGWTDPNDGSFDFAAHLIDEARDAISRGRARCARGQLLLDRHATADGAAGQVSPAAMMSILRDHGPEAEANPHWTPADTVGRTLCMHAGPGLRRSQSVASMVSELHEDGRPAIHWVTATSAPCLSIFKPVVLTGPTTTLPPQGPPPTDHYDPATLWWRHERLHRAVLRDYAALAPAIAAERDALEARFRARMAEAVAGGDVAAAVAECWREAEAAEASWVEAVAGQPLNGRGDPLARSWARLSAVAEFSAQEKLA
ncbi:MAG TPA: hypothetical protein VG939_04225 [Caulobacteraceae bacterium]|nr:hypothetical protein [Caulobacteraceae bacterium]